MSITEPQAGGAKPFVRKYTEGFDEDEASEWADWIVEVALEFERESASGDPE